MQFNTKRFAGLAALAALLAAGGLVGAPADLRAEEVKLYKEGEVPTADDLGKMFYQKKPKTRAIVIGGNEPAAPAQPEAFAFPVLFALNSADVPDSAKPYLDAVGKMLQADPEGKAKLVVEGHTDASGSDQYNLMLSQRRADSVKLHIVQHYGIDPGRVNALGKGEAELYDKDDPLSGENRRVQFRRGD